MTARFCLFLFLFPSLVMAKGDPADPSKAGADGPHVFYRGKKILVKSIEMEKDKAVAISKEYHHREDVLLTCRIPETGDAFSFGLHPSLEIPPHEYSLPDKMLVLSDIEGNFKALKTMLLGARVIDENFNWTFGNGHLVLIGDFFDRGLNVTECLWLIYKLEPEAEKARGKVHFIIGNHEVLNMEGHTQYVRNKYLDNARVINIQYEYWFDDHTEIGRWLRTKNAVEKVGDYVFCHGGISPELVDSKLTFEEINNLGRKYYGTPFIDIRDANGQMVFHPEYGIFWYRNASRNRLKAHEIEKIMAYAQANHIVVGHTLVPDVTSLYDGRYICIDLYHDENMRMGYMKTLYVEKGNPYGLDSRGEKSSIFSVAMRVK